MAKKQDIVAVEIPVVTPEQVQQMIREIRGEKVIMFQLTDREKNMISWSQIVTLENKQGRKKVSLNNLAAR